MTYKKFPAKVLLFGEHLLLRGATALSIPLLRYSGHWAWTNSNDALSKQGRLHEFCESHWLRDIPGMDTDAFAAELAKGMWFRSNMPSGYGLGSSGVLCAAVYDRYCREKTTDVHQLREDLAHMESFFHQRSSGIDPLTSYLQAPILIKNKTEVERAICPDWHPHLKIYLLDTRQSRQSGPLVRRFQEQCEHPKFAKELEHFLVETHEPMIEQFLAADYDGFWKSLGHCSEFQFDTMRFLIPRETEYRWNEGLRSGDFFLKICGAGGGGHMLLFVKNPQVEAFLNRLYRLTEVEFPV